jgi:hypothetical protein
MSLPPPEYRFVSPTVRITAWDDPVVDLLGHDPRSPYAEQFWLPVLGPSTTFLLRHLAARLEDQPDGFDLVIDDTARLLGLGTRTGLGSPFIRALARSGQFRHTRSAGPDALAVRRRLPGLTRAQVGRLPSPLRDRHDAWQQREQAEPTVEQRRTRARRLALSLLELGETAEATEQQLHRWRIHPAMAHEAMRWAQVRRGGAGAGVPPAPATPSAPGIPAVPAVPPVPAASGAFEVAAADRPGRPVAMRAGGPGGSRPKIGATRPAPGARFDPYEPPDAA